MTIPKKKKRPVAVLYMPHTVAAVIAFATFVVKAVSNSRHFPDATPRLDMIRKAINELRCAEVQASLRTRGAAEARDAKLATVVALMGSLCAHVQGVADLDPVRGLAIIRSAGLWVRKEREHKAVQFHAKPGDEPGTVKISAPAAAKRASYQWEYSLDRGKTWDELAWTLQARTSLSGVPRQSVVEIRYRATTSAGEGGWLGPIAVFVP